MCELFSVYKVVSVVLKEWAWQNSHIKYFSHMTGYICSRNTTAAFRWVWSIWKLNTNRYHLKVHNLQMHCSDLMKWVGTSLVVPVMSNPWPGWTLFWVMTAPSHYMNQWWLLSSVGFLETNFNALFVDMQGFLWGQLINSLAPWVFGWKLTLISNTF